MATKARTNELGRTGGGAVDVVHGCSYVTQDIDICGVFVPDSLLALQEALADLHPVHRMTPGRKFLELTGENGGKPTPHGASVRVDWVSTRTDLQSSSSPSAGPSVSGPLPLSNIYGDARCLNLGAILGKISKIVTIGQEMALDR